MKPEDPETCDVCGAFGAYGWGPPERAAQAYRCELHVWPEWRLPHAERVVAARALDRAPNSAVATSSRGAQQVDLFGGAKR